MLKNILKQIFNRSNESQFTRKRSNSWYMGLHEIELRDICKHSIETFESWSRRLIDEQFTSKYGKNYYDYVSEKGVPNIKSKIKKQIEGRMKENPDRFPRRIDAILIEDIEYFFCREDFYSTIFKPILEKLFSGSAEVRSVLERIAAIRNKLSHGNTISVHEAEQCICYTNDFIEVFKLFYQEAGKSKEYNVPVFIRVKDSLGHDIVREDPQYTWSIHFNGGGLRPKVQLRSGEQYKIWVEVDSSFDANTYTIIWYVNYDFYDTVKKGYGNEIILKPCNKTVSYSPSIKIKLISNKDWHRFANIKCDDLIEIHLDNVLPPIESTY